MVICRYFKFLCSFCFVFFPLCRLACGIIARSAGLFQNPKQICACDGITLWEERDRPIAGKGRSKNNPETPAAHLWTSQTSRHWWEFEQGGQKASWREMQILDGARVLMRRRQSPNDYCTDDQTAMNGLNFMKMFFDRIKRSLQLLFNVFLSILNMSPHQQDVCKCFLSYRFNFSVLPSTCRGMWVIM